MTGRPERGFSLLEVMIALAVLALGLTAAYRLTAVDLDVVNRAEDTTRACLTAESLFTRFRAFGLPADSREQMAVNGFTVKVNTFPVDDSGLFRLVRLNISGGLSKADWDFSRIMPGGQP